MIHRFSLSLALVLLCATMAGVLCLGGVGRDLQANLAYVDLVHGLLGLPESRGRRAERFEAWAAARGSSDMAGPAAVYGRAMLAKADAIPGDSSIVAYLDALETSESRREMLILALLGEARTPGDVRIAAQLLGEPRASQWLANTAVLRWRAGDRDWPQVLLQVLCESGDPAGLPADEVQEVAKVCAEVGWYVRSGDPEGAIHWFDRALSLVPNHLAALLWKGSVLGALGDMAGRREYTRRALESYPQSGDAWRFWASYLESSGQLGEAEVAIDRALALAPGDGWNHYVKARILLQGGRCEQALQELEGTKGDDPNLAAGRAQLLGDAYWCLGERAAAVDAYRQLESLRPELLDATRQERLRTVP